MPFAPTAGQTCNSCKFWDSFLAQCHQKPPPFAFCSPLDGCSFWAASGTTATTPPLRDITQPDSEGYVA